MRLTDCKGGKRKQGGKSALAALQREAAGAVIVERRRDERTKGEMKRI